MPDPRYPRPQINSGLTRVSTLKLCGHARGYRCTHSDDDTATEERFEHEPDVLEQMSRAKRRFQHGYTPDMPSMRESD